MKRQVYEDNNKTPTMASLFATNGGNNINNMMHTAFNFKKKTFRCLLKIKTTRKFINRKTHDTFLTIMWQQQ